MNVLENYDKYYPMFNYAYPAEVEPIYYYEGNYTELVKEHGYRKAYVMIAEQLCVDGQ